MQQRGRQASVILGAALCVAAGAGITYIGITAGPTDAQQGAARDAVSDSGTDDVLTGREIVVIDEGGQDGSELVTGALGDREWGDLAVLPVREPLFEYVEVTDSCPHDFSGECVNIRSGPGTDFASVKQLRNGQVLKVGGVVERDGRTWYQLVFHENEWLRYPDRITGEWYVAGEYVTKLLDAGPKATPPESLEEITKRIVVDRSDQTLAAYDGDELFMEEPISTGLELSPTPAGTFTVFRKTPSRYMQGPIPGISSKSWDLPGVPWVLYFTAQGGAIHGTFWHNDFGSRASAGCVNLTPQAAKRLYAWADVGTKVIVRE